MAPKLLKLPAVLTRVGFSRAKIYALIKQGAFPAPISLGARAVAWLDHEVDDWINAAIKASRGADSTGACQKGAQ